VIVKRENMSLKSTPTRKVLSLSIGLFLFSMALRLFHLKNQSLWLDEAVIFSQISKDSIYEVIASVEGHLGPFYHVLIFLFSKIAGTSEWALRFPSAMFGSISVVLTYLVARKIFDDKLALIASFFMMFSPIHIWYSQEARMYSLWIMLILLCTYVFMLAVEKSNLKRWLIFTICASCSIWTYLNSAFFFVGMFLFLLLQYKQYKKQIIIFSFCMTLVIASFYPGIIAFLNKESMGIGSSRPTGIFDLAYAFLAFSFGTTFGPSLVEIRSLKNSLGTSAALEQLVINYGTLLIPAIIAAISLFIYSSIKLFKYHPDNQKLFFATMFITPALAIFLIAYFAESIPFNVRYMLCALPFYYMLLALGMKYLSGIFLPLSMILIFSIFGISLFNHYENNKYAKVEMNKAIAYASSHMKENDKSLIFYEHARVVLEYYDNTNKLKNSYVPLNGTLDSCKNMVKNAQCVYFIQTIRTQQYPQKLISDTKSYFSKTFATRRDIHFINAEINVFCNKKQ